MKSKEQDQNELRSSLGSRPVNLIQLVSGTPCLHGLKYPSVHYAGSKDERALSVWGSVRGAGTLACIIRGNDQIL